MASELDLITRRHRNVTEMRGLVENAEGATRDLDDNETARFEQLAAEVSDFDRQLAGIREDRANPVLPATNGAGQPVGVHRDQARMNAPMPAGSSFADLLGVRSDPAATGRYIRALALEDHETLADMRSSLLTGDAAGMLPTAVAANVFDVARAASRVAQAGAPLVPLEEGSVKAAVVTSDPVPGWRAEGAAIPTSKPNITPITFAPKSLAVVTRLSWELLQDTSDSAQGLVTRLIAEAFANEWDRAALLGDGSGESPTGLDQIGATTIDVEGPPTWRDLANAVRDLKTANHVPGRFIGHPRDAAALELQTDLQGRFISPPDYLRDNVPVLETSKIATNGGTGENESRMYVGDWRNLLLGVRLDMEIMVLRERYADTGEVGIMAHFRGDVQFVRTDAFRLLGKVEPEPTT